jgi:hypothetical protein
MFIVSSIVVYNRLSACQICIIDSTCTDDFIHFNVSISDTCQYPLAATFSYDTDIDAERHYINQTINCSSCTIDLMIDTINDAWDYTVRLDWPQLDETCTKSRVARCGGETSPIVWIATASLSGMFIVFGGILCMIRYCRRHRRQYTTKTSNQTSTTTTTTTTWCTTIDDVHWYVNYCCDLKFHWDMFCQWSQSIVNMSVECSRSFLSLLNNVFKHDAITRIDTVVFIHSFIHSLKLIIDNVFNQYSSCSLQCHSRLSIVRL